MTQRGIDDAAIVDVILRHRVVDAERPGLREIQSAIVIGEVGVAVVVVLDAVQAEVWTVIVPERVVAIYDRPVGVCGCGGLQVALDPVDLARC